jgi:hypothetical protein
MVQAESRSVAVRDPSKTWDSPCTGICLVAAGKTGGTAEQGVQVLTETRPVAKSTVGTSSETSDKEPEGSKEKATTAKSSAAEGGAKNSFFSFSEPVNERTTESEEDKQPKGLRSPDPSDNHKSL